MHAIAIGLLTSVLVFAGGLLGLGLRRVLPNRHLEKETQDVVRLGSGMVSVVASLVLGLLIATAKTSSDNLDHQMQAYSADLLVMDEVLRSYGPSAAPLRDLLHRSTLRTLHDITPTASKAFVGLDDATAGALLEQLQQRLRSLATVDAEQAALRSDALTTVRSLLRQRWLLVDKAQPSVRRVVLGVVVCWIVAIFMSFGLGAPGNATVVCSFALSALAIGAAMFLILEIDSPLQGILHISVAPLQTALAEFGPGPWSPPR